MKAFQHSIRSHARIAGLVVFAVVLAVSAQGAIAIDKARFDYQGASGVCQPSLPQYEPNLKSRPLGLANAGPELSFVTCALQGSDPTGQRGAYQVQVNVTNNDTVAKFIRCTLVVVYRLSGETVDKTAYIPRTVTVIGGGGSFISWVPTDITGAFGGPEISKAGISCALPAKTTLQYTGTYYREDVGA
ncbi:MAG: hypothetical protein ABJA62_04185 [Luteimonas sp.]